MVCDQVTGPGELAVVTALPPWDGSSARFREGAYSYPENVLVRLPVDRVGDVDLLITQFAPGTRLLVLGRGERRWRAVLTRVESGQFTVTRAPLDLREPPGGAMLAGQAQPAPPGEADGAEAG